MTGIESAKVTLEEVSKRALNECFLADVQTRQIVGQMNVPRARRMIKRIFQISYDVEEGIRRSEVLKSLGDGVISVVGNAPAKVPLSSIQNYDLFIVGHGAPEASRKEMVEWLKTKYPGVKILALNPPLEQMPNADYNAVQNGPEAWLPFVTEQLANYE